MTQVHVDEPTGGTAEHWAVEDLWRTRAPRTFDVDARIAGHVGALLE
ncbi:MAG: hypothetical protein ACR2KJ_16125 [Jatrophihabitans sp.]